MSGMVASRSMQMLEKNKFREHVKDTIEELVSAMETIEKLFNIDRKSREVMENMKTIRSLAYSIEDALETCAVYMELVNIFNNNEKKRVIPRFLRCFGREYDADTIIWFVKLIILMKCDFQLEYFIRWLNDTFPKDVFQSEHSAGPEQSIANHRSVLWPRQEYARSGDEHFVGMKKELKDLSSAVVDKKNRVVTIWGAKGLGKTTLAKKVYFHDDVRSNFQAFARVRLDQGYEIRSFLQNILNQLGAGEVKKSAEEQKKSAEGRRNRSQNMKKQGIGAVKKSEEEKKTGAEELEKGAEEEKKLAEVQIEGADEKIMGPEEQRKGIETMNDVPEEKIEIVDEKKNDTEEKGSAEEKKKRGEKMKEDEYGAEEPKEGVEKEGAEEKRKGVEEQKEGEEEEKKKGAEDHKKGAEEQKKGTGEKKEGVEEEKKVAKKLTIAKFLLRKLSTGSMKKCADEQINATEEKKERDEEQKEGAEEKKKGDMEKKEGPEARKEGVAKHKKGIETNNKGADKIKGVEKQKKGAEETKEGAEEKRKGTKDLIIVKKSIGEPKHGEEEKKKGAEENNNDAKEQQKSSEEEIRVKLEEILKQKRCFVVIDGISQLSQWEEIRTALVMDDADTKFLLTTEDERTAQVGNHCHHLRNLNADEGWELLKKYAFHGKTAPEFGVVPKLGKEIVAKCEHLPSKISSLGRTLSAQFSGAISLSDWHMVNGNVTAYLQRDQQTKSNERYDAPDPDYHCLSYMQKQRFLYLAIFKENEDVDPEDLSFLWMGEGMVQHEKDKEGTIMDTTEVYLRNLAPAKLLKVDEMYMRFLPFSLPNHARQLSLDLGEKEDFRLKVVDFSDAKEPEFDEYIMFEGTRRLAIHFNELSSSSPDKSGCTSMSTGPPKEENLLKKIYFCRRGFRGGGDGSEQEKRNLKETKERILKATGDLRSLLFVNSDREYVSLPVRISDFQEFTLLRVLHFVRCKFEDRKLPEGIWTLLNLKYFGLLYCDLDELPQSISNLKYLQVLNVRSYDDAIISIPEVISKLARLKHLRLPHNYKQCTEKLKFGDLKELETLVGFNDDIHDIDSLSELKNFRYLGIHASSNDQLKSLINKFSKFVDVRISLSMEYKCDFTSPVGSSTLEEVLMSRNLDALSFSMVHIHNFPNCGEYASPHLTQIKLIGCELSEDPMEALGKFCNLRKLCLRYGAFVGKEMAISNEGFSKLEYLEFHCLPNLEKWRVAEKALPELSEYIVVWCPKLQSIPKELADREIRKLDHFSACRQ